MMKTATSQKNGVAGYKALVRRDGGRKPPTPKTEIRMTENYRFELSTLARRGERGVSLMDVDMLTCDEMAAAGHAEWIKRRAMDRFRVTQKGKKALAGVSPSDPEI
jgi:hypothetical protein